MHDTVHRTLLYLKIDSFCLCHGRWVVFIVPVAFGTTISLCSPLHFSRSARAIKFGELQSNPLESSLCLPALLQHNTTNGCAPVAEENILHAIKHVYTFDSCNQLRRDYSRIHTPCTVLVHRRWLACYVEMESHKKGWRGQLFLFKSTSSFGATDTTVCRLKKISAAIICLSGPIVQFFIFVSGLFVCRH